MKIALVQPKFDDSGGAERYAGGLAASLAARGHEVHLFGRTALRVPPGARFHRVPALPVGRALKTLSFERLCCRRVAPDLFDVVQGFAKTTCQTVHRAGGGIHRAFMERRPEAGRTWYDRVAVAIEDALFASPRLRAVIVPSRWVGEEIERHYPRVSGLIRRIPNGVNTDLFKPEGREANRAGLLAEWNVPPEAPVLLFAATNFRLKGLLAAIEGLAHLRSAYLVVAGGDDPEPFRKVAREAGVEERVVFVGGGRDIAGLYRAADVLVHPTLWDTFGNVCLEAAACGTPVVTTDQAGAADVLSDAGVVLRHPVKPEELARAVEELLARGLQGRERARGVAVAHNLERHVDVVEALYGEVVGGPGGEGLGGPG